MVRWSAAAGNERLILMQSLVRTFAKNVAGLGDHVRRWATRRNAGDIAAIASIENSGIPINYSPPLIVKPGFCDDILRVYRGDRVAYFLVERARNEWIITTLKGHALLQRAFAGPESAIAEMENTRL